MKMNFKTAVLGLTIYSFLFGCSAKQANPLENQIKETFIEAKKAKLNGNIEKFISYFDKRYASESTISQGKKWYEEYKKDFGRSLNAEEVIEKNKIRIYSYDCKTKDGARFISNDNKSFFISSPDYEPRQGDHVLMAKTKIKHPLFWDTKVYIFRKINNEWKIIGP